jgi:heme/copper-type cytochrome/quinol oxidase subunit 1
MDNHQKLPPATLAVLIVPFMLLLTIPAGAAEVDELSLDDLLNTRITTASKFTVKEQGAKAERGSGD